MKNIKLVLSYDGSAYLGWQKTEHGPSVEETLEKALHKILGNSPRLQAASRTDKGVHANNQIVNFFTGKELDFSTFQYGVNALLPDDIRILDAACMPDNFHPTTDALRKTYLYQIYYSPILSPHMRFSTWHIPYQLNIDAMQREKDKLLGKRDFVAFCNNSLSKPENTVRNLFTIDIKQVDDLLCFEICGDHFLYKMVRNIVGTLVDVGRGKIEQIDSVLEGKDRTKAGITAPAQGLFLQDIEYGGENS